MKWIEIDPNQKNTIPMEPIWGFTIKTKEVVFFDRDKFIPLNTISHYCLIEKPEPPTQ